MLNIIDRGKNNRVSAPETLNGTVTLDGDDNEVVIGEETVSDGIWVQLGNRTRISIGASCRLGSLFVHAADDATVEVGDGTGFNGLVRLLLHEARAIRIGRGCLFGGPTDLTVSDMHSIVDANTGIRVNPPRDVVVGERVWVGQNCIVLKGTTIGPGSIIGAGSVVSGSVPSNVVAAGSPPRVIRTGVTWTHALLPIVDAPAPASRGAQTKRARSPSVPEWLRKNLRRRFESRE